MLCLSQQQLPWRRIQVLLPTILLQQSPSRGSLQLGALLAELALELLQFGGLGERVDVDAAAVRVPGEHLGGRVLGGVAREADKVLALVVDAGTDGWRSEDGLHT